MWLWKALTDTNGYPFEQVNGSLSVHHPFEHLKKSVQSVQVCIYVQNTLASIRKYCDICWKGFCSSSMHFCCSNSFLLVSILPFRLTNVQGNV